MDNLNLAIYPGSFDPITYGHLDVLERALKIFDSIIVLLASNAQKINVFSAEERLNMIRTCVNDKRVLVDNLDKGLVVHYAALKRAKAIIRGLRQVSDFEHEYQISLMNRHLHSDITTVFLLSNEKYTYLASSIVKEVSRLGGDVTDFVPPHVAAKLKSHYGSSNSKKIPFIS